MPPVPMKKQQQQQQQEPPPPAAAEPPPIKPPKQLRDFPEYAGPADKLLDLRQQQGATRLEREGLQAELGRDGRLPDVELAALELLGDAEQGAAAATGGKHVRLKELIAREAALNRAVAIQERVVDEAAFQAGRKILADAAPAHRRLVLAHVEAVVLAAKSALPLLRFVDDLDAATPASMSGSGTMGYGCFAHFGDPRDHNSTFSIWLSGLISDGTLTGNEPFLEGVALVARRPDNSVVDRPTPPPLAMTAWASPPDPDPKSGPSFLGAVGAVGAAVQRGVNAVASLVSPGNPGRDALPPTPAVVSSSHAPAVKGPTRTIRLLRGMATAANEWPAGSTVPWHAADAARMVERGVAVWADGVPEAAK